MTLEVELPCDGLIQDREKPPNRHRHNYLSARERDELIRPIPQKDISGTSGNDSHQVPPGF